MAEISKLQSVQGEMLKVYLWKPTGKTKGIVQLVHGMCEHMGRYEATANELNKAGYLVIGHTQLGHNTVSKPLGYFGDQGGWDALIADVHTLRQKTCSQYPDLPYYLLGHSMGSFVVRGYCLKHEEGLSGVILSGTGHYAPAIVTFAGGVASLQCALGMGKKPGKLLNKLSCTGYLKGYENVQTPFDWLSRDRKIVQSYMDDPYCGFTFTVNAYRDMFDGLSRLYPQKLSGLKADIPVLFFSGMRDPVGAYGKGVEKVAQEWRDAGVKDVCVKLYPEGRHEMFNELNREEVWKDLIDWLNRANPSDQS